MYSIRYCFALSAAILFLTGPGVVARAQSGAAVAASARISRPVESASQNRLQGHIPSWATAENDLGAVAPSRRLDNLHLILARAPQVQSAFDQLLADQQNPASPRFHQWLTPQQTAAQYGIAPSDLAAVTHWLQSQGLTVDDVGSGGVFITFSGPASSVENAFSTTLHSFSHDDASRYAPIADPAIPAALTGVIQAVDGLAEEVAHIHSRSALATPDGAVPISDGPRPLYNSGSGAHYTAPGDFNKIYDIKPIYNSGINGAGLRVVNLIDSRIVPSDITGFNSVFGLSVAQPSIILLPGSTDPGVKAASEGEASLDVQRILGTAPGVAVDLLVFSNLSFTNIFSALQYEVGTLNDPVVNMSFGACNAGASSFTQSSAFDAYFKTGAAQGISFFVSSGDDAAAGCDSNYSSIPAAQVLATNLICASSYVTCVGGTQFAENSTAYWSGANSSTRVSATGYIPEGAWDEPTVVNGSQTTYQASGTGGGLTLFPKPSWQTGVGVPADNIRDVPDVSFTAAYHDGYLICQADIGNVCASGTFKYIIFGTSASSPSMAGIAALLDQKLGSRQGNLNPLFYGLAATPSNSVFHDVTVTTSGVSFCSTGTPSICNNSTPSGTSLSGGLAGYAVGPGYDLATGLGSMDVSNFIAATVNLTGPTFPTSLALTLSANSITTLQTLTLTATLTSTGTSATPTGTVQFYANGNSVASATLTAFGTATSVPLTFPVAGTFAVTAVYSGDASFLPSTSPAVSLVVNSVPVPAFTLSDSPGTLTLTSGATSGNTEPITLNSVNGFAGTVTFTCSISASSAADPPVCTLSPTNLALAAGGTATTIAMISTSPTHTAVQANENIAFSATGAVFALLLCLAPFRRRRMLSLASFIMVVAGFTALSGCGSGVRIAPSATTTSSVGTYTVTVTGTGTAAGSTAATLASTTFTLKVD